MSKNSRHINYNITIKKLQYNATINIYQLNINKTSIS